MREPWMESTSSEWPSSSVLSSYMQASRASIYSANFWPMAYPLELQSATYLATWGGEGHG